MMCGGHSDVKHPDAQENAYFVGMKALVEEKVGQQFTDFEVVHFTSQVVAGTIFRVKYRTDQGFVHAKVLRPLPHTQQPSSIMAATTGHTEDEAFAMNM